MKKLFVIILAALLIPLQAWGLSYYVCPADDATTPGLDSRTPVEAQTNTTPWATISRVQDGNVTNGDTVYFCNQGTWSTKYTVDLSSAVLHTTVAGVTYNGNTYGTKSKPRATLQAPTALGAVVNINSDNITITGFDIDMNSKYTGGIYAGYFATTVINNDIIDNCTIHDNDVSSGFAYGIQASGHGRFAYNITITNNEVYNVGHEGIAIYPPWGSSGLGSGIDKALVRNNVVHDTGLNGGSTWGNGINIYNNSDNVTVEFNTIYNTYRSIGIGTSGDDLPYNCANVGSPNKVVVRYNLIYNNLTYGINMQPSCGMQGDGDIYSNIFLNNAREINITGDSYARTWGTSAFNFYNNIFYNTVKSSTTDGLIGISEAYEFYGRPVFTFKNNIVYSANAPGITDLSDGIVHSNNLLYRSSGSTGTVISSEKKTALEITSTKVWADQGGDDNYTRFHKNGGDSWATLMGSCSDKRIKWTGFSTSSLNDQFMSIGALTADQITLRFNLHAYDNDTVSAEIWCRTAYDRTEVNAATGDGPWEATAKTTDPLFEGGTLPTGFSGIYGTDMIPNSNYFNIGSGAGGAAYDNGTTLAGYEGAINGAGLATPVTRPQGAAYDIGAYEYYATAVYSIPGAPTIGTATAGYKSASVAFSAGDDGNSTITSYTATSSPGSITGTAASSPITVSGITNYTAYTFTVTATNAIGTGPASSASNEVTPIEPVNSTGSLGGNLK